MIALNVYNEDVDKYIKHIAEYLFHQNLLLINNDVYNFTELEFYFYSNYHKDEYCHIKDIKENNYKTGDLRFHYSGIDLVIYVKNQFVCGVLIRGIKNCKTEQCINGPLRVLTTVCNNLNNLCASGENILKLQKLNSVFTPKIANIVRYGLNKKYSKFANKKYRYILIDIIEESNKVYYNSHIKKYIM
jgi:hypothetical protein